MTVVPEIELSDMAVMGDRFAAYGRAREQGPVARLLIPGFGSTTPGPGAWPLTVAL